MGRGIRILKSGRSTVAVAGESAFGGGAGKLPDCGAGRLLDCGAADWAAGGLLNCGDAIGAEANEIRPRMKHVRIIFW